MKRGRLKVDPEKVLAWKRRTAKPLKKRSRKMAATYRNERVPFVAAFLAANPWCALQLSGCTRRATTVNEVIRRSHSGAIYPGQPGKRETAYMPACISCHSWLTNHAKEARANGWEVR